jgi:hypothetical protein
MKTFTFGCPLGTRGGATSSLISLRNRKNKFGGVAAFSSSFVRRVVHFTRRVWKCWGGPRLGTGCPVMPDILGVCIWQMWKTSWGDRSTRELISVIYFEVRGILGFFSSRLIFLKGTL